MAETLNANPTEVENTIDTTMDDDDATVATTTTGTKTDFIEEEMEEQGLRFEIPYRKGQANSDDIKLHAQLLHILTTAYDDTELRIFNNKNKKIKNFQEKKWEDKNYHKTHFGTHVDKVQRKTVIAHRIHAQKSISSLKGEPTVIAFLKSTNTYLRAHYWKEDELELKDIGFLLSYVPTKHSKNFVKKDMLKRTEALPNLDWTKVPPFQLIHAQPQVKLPGKHKAMRTHSYSVQVQTKDAPAMNKFLRALYSDAHLYMPYSMKRQFPKAVAQAIVKQNQLIADTFVIVLVGVSRDVMQELQTTILTETPGSIAISDTHRTDKTGRWYVIIKEKAFLTGRKLIAANLQKWMQTLPASLHETTPADFPPPRVNQKYADEEDDSSGHASYMSSCAQSYGTFQEDDTLDEAFFCPPSNERTYTHSYADAARNAPSTNQNQLAVTEIQFSETETALRSVIQDLKNELRQLKGAQTPSTVTDVSIPESEASKMRQRMDNFENNVQSIQTMMQGMQEMMRATTAKRNPQETPNQPQENHQAKRADTRGTPERASHQNHNPQGLSTQPSPQRILQYADNGDGSMFPVWSVAAPPGGYPQTQPPYIGNSHGHGQRGQHNTPPGGWVHNQFHQQPPPHQQHQQHQQQHHHPPDPTSPPRQDPEEQMLINSPPRSLLAEGAKTYRA
jgi:hypothetical protein